MLNKIIDSKDRKILQELNHNSRQSYNTIAKNTKLSKNQVVYRINRMINDGIITKFCAVINHTILNYHYYRFFFKFKNTSKEILNEMIEFIKNMENIYFVAKGEGVYDLIIESIHNRVSHAIENYLLFSKEFSQYIDEKELNLVAHGYNLPNNYLYENFVTEVNLLRELHDNEERIKLTGKEKQIINKIKDNSRINVIEIANDMKLSTKTVISKLRQFEKENVITKYRISINHNIFGFEQFHVFLQLNYKKTNTSLICEYLIQQKSIIRIVKPVGNQDLEFRCLVKNTYELIDIINNLKDKFPAIIRSYEWALITEVHPINTVKF